MTANRIMIINLIVLAACVFIPIIVIKRLKTSPSVFFMGAAAGVCQMLASAFILAPIFNSIQTELDNSVIQTIIYVAYAACYSLISLAIVHAIKDKGINIKNAVTFGLGTEIPFAVNSHFSCMWYMFWTFYRYKFEYNLGISYHIEEAAISIANAIVNIFIVIMIFKAITHNRIFFIFAVIVRAVLMGAPYPINAAVHYIAAVIMIIYIIKQLKKDNIKEPIQTNGG